MSLDTAKVGIWFGPVTAPLPIVLNRLTNPVALWFSHRWPLGRIGLNGLCRMSLDTAKVGIWFGPVTAPLPIVLNRLTSIDRLTFAAFPPAEQARNTFS